MAKNDIQFNIGFTVDGEGNLKANMAQLKAMAKETASLSQHTETATKSKNAFNKAEKGAAELTSNSTKAFAKQAQTMSTGTVKAYATLAANIFAVTAAFNALSRAAGVEQLAKGLEVIGNQGGRNLMKVAESLVAITDSAVSAEQAMRTVAVGTSAGFSTTQMERLTKVAKGASLALGRDMSDAMDRLIRGTAKLEPEILDELGIMVRLDDVVSEYAKSIGGTTTAVSAYEKRMAFANAVTEQGEKKFGAIADAIDPNPYSQLSAAFQDLTKNGLNLINTVITPLISIVASSQGLIAGVGAMFASTFAAQMLPALADGADRMEVYARSLNETAKSSMASITPMKSLKQATQDNIKAMASGNLTAEEYSKAMRKLSGTILSTKSSLAQTEAAGNLTAASYAIRTKKIEHLEQVQRSLNKSYGQLLTAEYKQIQSGALEMATQGELRNSLKQTGLAISSMYAAQTSATMQSGLMTTGFKTLWTTLKAGTMVVRTLGTAFLSMLPVIGQVIILGSLVYQAWQWLNKPTEAQKALSELESVVSRTADVASQLDKTLKHTKDNTSAFLAELKAGSGQIESFAQAVQTALDADKAPEGKTGDLYKQLARYQKEYIAYGDAQSKNAINAIQAQIDAWEDIGKVGEDTLRKLTLETNNLVTEISKNPALLAGMGKGYEKLLELQTKLNSSKGSMTKEEVERYTLALLEHSKAYDKINTAIDSSKESQVGYRKELSSLLEVKSEFDGIVSAAAARFTEFDRVLKNTELTAEQLTKTFEGLLDSFNDEEAINIATKGIEALGKAAKDASQIEIFKAGLQAQKEQWEVVRATTQEYKNQADAIAAKADSLKAASEFSPKALEQTFDIQNSALAVQINAINVQIEAYRKQENSLDKIKQLEGERNKLAREKTKDIDINYAMQQLEQKLLNERVAAENKAYSNGKSLLEQQVAYLEIEEKIASLKLAKTIDRPLTGMEEASRELELFNSTKKLKEDLIKKEEAHAVNSLEIEYNKTKEALDRKHALASGDTAAQAIIKATMDAEEAAFINAKNSISNTAQLAILEINRMGLELQGNLELESQKAALERIKEIAQDIADIKFDKFEALEKLSEISFEGLGDYADVGKSLNTVVKTFQTVGKAKAELSDNRKALTKTEEWLQAEIAAGQDVTAEYQKWSDANVKLTEQENASKTSMMIAYGQAASGVLMSLAETQDQTSRQGFEAAKAMQMGAAVVNTAGAIMNAMATVQPYPAALVAAGIAAATGAMQIATIANTKFGDSTAPSAGGGMSSSLGASSGNGTVLGDRFKISESASKTDELLEEIHAKEYGKLAIIANEVASLNRNITGLVTNIVRSFGNFDTSQYSSSSNSFMQDLVTSGKHLDIFNASTGLFGANQITSFFDNMLPEVGGLLGGINDTINKFLGSAIGSIFGGKTKTKAIEAGLYLGEMTTAQLMTGVYNWVWEYAKTKTKVDGGWFGKDKTYYNTYYEDVDSSIQLMFNQIFSSVSTSLVEVTRQLGGDVNKALNYTFESMYINLQGMDSDKINETITGVINETADKAFQAVLEPIIGMYQRLDEGLMETAIRLVATKATVDEAIKAGSGYTRTLESSSIEAVLRNSLPATSDIINQITLDISNSLTELAGGLKEFQEAFNTYYDAFFTDQEKFIRNTSNLAEVFSAQQIGNLPQTRESYKQLVAMLDLSTEKGRETYVSLLQLSELASEYYSYIEEIEEKRFELNLEIIRLTKGEYAALNLERQKEIDSLQELSPALAELQRQIYSLEVASSRYSMEIEYLNLLGRQEDAIALTRIQELAAIDPLLHSLQKQIWATEDLKSSEEALAETRREALQKAEEDLKNAFQAEKDRLTGVFDTLIESLDAQMSIISDNISLIESAMNTLKNSINSMEDINIHTYREYTSSLNNILREVQQGNYKSLENISEITSILTKDISDLYSSAVDYNRDRALALISMNALSSELEQGLTTEEKALKALEDTKEEAKAQHLQTLENLDSQLNSILGIEEVTLSIDQAITNYQSLVEEVGNVSIEWLKTINESIINLGDIMAGMLSGSSALGAASSSTASRITSSPNEYLAVKALEFNKGVASGAYSAQDYGISGKATSSDILKAISDAGMTPQEHYAKFGAYESLPGYTTSFDEQKYLEAKTASFNASVSAGLIDPTKYGLSGVATTEQIANSIAQAGMTLLEHYATHGAYEGIPGFASGGSHLGGWRLVGEEGPELEYTGKSTIFSNSASGNMLDFSALAEEIRKLREDLSRANYQIAKNTADAAKLLSRWDGDGLPEEREVLT